MSLVPVADLKGGPSAVAKSAMMLNFRDDRGRIVRPFAGWAVVAIRALRSSTIFAILITIGYIGFVLGLPGTGLSLMVPVTLSAIVLACMWYPFLLPRNYFRRLRLGMLGAGRCASCGYALRDIAVSADGCTLCPECGAAWRFIADEKD